MPAVGMFLASRAARARAKAALTAAEFGASFTVSSKMIALSSNAVTRVRLDSEDVCVFGVWVSPRVVEVVNVVVPLPPPPTAGAGSAVASCPGFADYMRFRDPISLAWSVIRRSLRLTESGPRTGVPFLLRLGY